MKKALIVGINDYPGAILNGCVNDANSIADVLEFNGDKSLNFDVKRLTVPSEVINRAKLKGLIESLYSGSVDIALFYFSGHGIVTSTGGYIVTPDFKKYDEGVSMYEILTLANNSKAKNKVIILDCCYSGAFGTPNIDSANICQLSEGMSVLTASRDFESAIEINGHGVFTSLVLSALQGGASDLRGHITPGSIYAFVDQALGPWDQRPVFKTNVTRFVSLRTVLPPIPLETLRKLCVYFPSAKQSIQLDPSYEFTNSIKDDAHVAMFKDLQKYERVGLVVPTGEEHMYFAALNSKTCKLTALGHRYWQLVNEKKL